MLSNTIPQKRPTATSRDPASRNKHGLVRCCQAILAMRLCGFVLLWYGKWCLYIRLGCYTRGLCCSSHNDILIHILQLLNTSKIHLHLHLYQHKYTTIQPNNQTTTQNAHSIQNHRQRTRPSAKWLRRRLLGSEFRSTASRMYTTATVGIH